MKRIEARARFPFFWKRYFVYFVFGADLRAHQVATIGSERRKNSPFALSFVFLTLLMWLAMASSVLAILGLYVLKSVAGIDIVQASSPLQELLHYLKLCHNLPHS
jgi:hypothetical protein